MTIQQLIDAASRLDPNIRIEVYEKTTYRPRLAPEREVRVRTTSTLHGEGSHEDITLDLYGRGPLAGDVRGVVPGSTTTYWQVAPLLDALRENTPQAES